MSKIKGTVTRAGKGQYSYFLQLDGNDFYYNTKFKPKCGEGDGVGIEFTSKDDSRGQITNVKVFEENSGGYDKSNSEKSEGGGGKSGGGGGTDRNQSIVYQSSRKDALVFVGILLGAEAFAVKGKADARRVQLDELLDEYTRKFYAAAIDPASAVAENGGEESDDAPEGESGDDWGDDWD